MVKKLIVSIALVIVSLIIFHGTASAGNSDPWNGYTDSWGNPVPGLITNETWMTPMPKYVSGKAVFYSPYTMEATAEYRGIDYEESGCIGGVSLMSPIDIGQKVWVKVEDIWYGPFCSVDCAKRGDMYSIVVIREEVVELSFDMALRLGMVSVPNSNGDYEVYHWYKDVEVFIGERNPGNFIKNLDIGCFIKPTVYRDHFLNTVQYATGWEPRIILTQDGIWKEYATDVYWHPPIMWYKPNT